MDDEPRRHRNQCTAEDLRHAVDDLPAPALALASAAPAFTVVPLDHPSVGTDDFRRAPAAAGPDGPATFASTLPDGRVQLVVSRLDDLGPGMVSSARSFASSPALRNAFELTAADGRRMVEAGVSPVGADPATRAALAAAAMADSGPVDHRSPTVGAIIDDRYGRDPESAPALFESALAGARSYQRPPAGPGELRFRDTVTRVVRPGAPSGETLQFVVTRADLLDAGSPAPRTPYGRSLAAVVDAVRQPTYAAGPGGRAVVSGSSRGPWGLASLARTFGAGRHRSLHLDPVALAHRLERLGPAAQATLDDALSGSSSRSAARDAARDRPASRGRQVDSRSA